MRWFALRLLTLPAAVLALSLAAACDQEGPAEQVGEKVDEGVERAGDAVERAGDRAD